MAEHRDPGFTRFSAESNEIYRGNRYHGTTPLSLGAPVEGWRGSHTYPFEASIAWGQANPAAYPVYALGDPQMPIWAENYPAYPPPVHTLPLWSPEPGKLTDSYRFTPLGALWEELLRDQTEQSARLHNAVIEQWTLKAELLSPQLTSQRKARIDFELWMSQMKVESIEQWGFELARLVATLAAGVKSDPLPTSCTSYTPPTTYTAESTMRCERETVNVAMKQGHEYPGMVEQRVVRSPHKVPSVCPVVNQARPLRAEPSDSHRDASPGMQGKSDDFSLPVAVQLAAPVEEAPLEILEKSGRPHADILDPIAPVVESARVEAEVESVIIPGGGYLRSSVEPSEKIEGGCEAMMMEMQDAEALGLNKLHACAFSRGRISSADTEVSMALECANEEEMYWDDEEHGPHPRKRPKSASLSSHRVMMCKFPNKCKSQARLEKGGAEAPAEHIISDALEFVTLIQEITETTDLPQQSKVGHKPYDKVSVELAIKPDGDKYESFVALQGIIAVQERMRARIETEYAAIKQLYDESRTPPKFKLGQKVLRLFDERDTKLDTYWQGPYVIVSDEGRNKYGVRRVLEDRVVFVHAERLRPFDDSRVTDNEIIAFARGMNSNWFVVESIVGHKMAGDTHMFRVKWKDYPSSENTWEPITGLSKLAAMRDYCRVHKLKMKDLLPSEDGETGKEDN
jgi:hypothetical protein